MRRVGRAGLVGNKPPRRGGRAKPMIVTPARAADAARRQLEALARPSSKFDASRYFRSDHGLGFHNIGARTVRHMAKAIVGERREQWRVTDALAFADRLIRDRHLETKGLGIEALACYRKQFTAQLLPTWKRWLAANHAANWATTDAICGSLAGPLLLAEPQLVRLMPLWARDKNLWVRRASAVSLIPSVRRGLAVDTAYRVAGLLHGDREDLIQKAVGWMLREAGRSDPARLERYLRANGPSIPRTTLRYAIEPFPPDKRRDLLAATRAAPQARPRAR